MDKIVHGRSTNETNARKAADQSIAAAVAEEITERWGSGEWREDLLDIADAIYVVATASHDPGLASWQENQIDGDLVQVPASSGMAQYGVAAVAWAFLKEVCGDRQ